MPNFLPNFSIFECQDIAQENCDSYAQIQLQIFDEFLTKKSKIKRKSSNPQFNESFCFEVIFSSNSSV